ncbi:hypothetical protein [Bacillus sp. FJAT-42315]|uniref:hypothetical protein n=1 Tax=Bacillus sp. FJAT-42315 TaxID=2014077 RepID=UPI001E2B4AF6|nr:hypothetical protein [Bacillus sp. FJAT-42315]
MMKQVVNGLIKQTQTKQRLAVIRLELDYELAVLFEAMQKNDRIQMEKSKAVLRKLWEQLQKDDEQ